MQNNRMTIKATWAEYLTGYEALYGVITEIIEALVDRIDRRCCDRSLSQKELECVYRLREHVMLLLPVPDCMTVRFEYPPSMFELNARRVQSLTSLPKAVDRALDSVLSTLRAEGFDIIVTLPGFANTFQPGVAPFTFMSTRPVSKFVDLPASTPKLTLMYVSEGEGDTQ